jgi:tellurite resistance protein
VKRLGTLAVRVLRAVLAADGTLDAEEARTLGALVGALGLPAEDVTTLHREALADVKDLEVYGEIEPAVARGVLRGAWLAAAWDGIDPREEEVIRIVAAKLSIETSDVEAARADVIKQVDARRAAGVAVVDGVRYVLSDRVPGAGVLLAASAGTLMIPRCYRDEALAQVGHGAPITLAKRHGALSAEARQTALAITWCAALYDDPSVARRALLRARFDRVAHDLGDDGTRARVLIDEWLGDAIAAFAVNLK